MSAQIEFDTIEEKTATHYVTPMIKEMSEEEILASFQITQSMGGWWTVPTC